MNEEKVRNPFSSYSLSVVIINRVANPGEIVSNSCAVGVENLDGVEKSVYLTSNIHYQPAGQKMTKIRSSNTVKLNRTLDYRPPVLTEIMIPTTKLQPVVLIYVVVRITGVRHDLLVSKGLYLTSLPPSTFKVALTS